MVLVEEHTKPFAAEEMQALRQSGLAFSTVPPAKPFNPVIELAKEHAPYFLRTCVQTLERCIANYPPEMFLVPDSLKVVEWHRLPRDYRWERYMQRAMGYVPVKRDSDGELIAPDLKEALGVYHNGKGVFVKSEDKSSLTARLYKTNDQAYLHVLEMIAFACHRSPTGLIISEPLEIDDANTEFKKAEYRLFIIGGLVSTASLFTDNTERHSIPGIVSDFGNCFAYDYLKDLPDAYTLDVALCDGRPVVVELNDIQASGLFAGHDMAAFYSSVEYLFNRYKA